MMMIYFVQQYDSRPEYRITPLETVNRQFWRPIERMMSSARVIATDLFICRFGLQFFHATTLQNTALVDELRVIWYQRTTVLTHTSLNPTIIH